MPGLTLGDLVPNLEVDTTHGKMKLHDYFNNSWTILFSHPGDFTPVCTTELAKMAAYDNEFAKKGAKLLGLSCDDLLSHVEWSKDVEAYADGHKVKYPIISDPNRQVMKQLNMVDPDAKDSNGRGVEGTRVVADGIKVQDCYSRQLEAWRASGHIFFRLKRRSQQDVPSRLQHS